MTKKEFLTNFLTGMGFQVLSYEAFSKNGNRVVLKSPTGDIGAVIVFTDRSSTIFDNVSVKFKWSHFIDATKDSDVAKDHMFRAWRWLSNNVKSDKEILVDWVKYKHLTHNNYHSGKGYLRLRSKGYLWDQQNYSRRTDDSEIFADSYHSYETVEESPNERFSILGLLRNIFR